VTRPAPVEVQPVAESRPTAGRSRREAARGQSRATRGEAERSGSFKKRKLRSPERPSSTDAAPRRIELRSVRQIDALRGAHQTMPTARLH
jgi:hypothetical protein